MGSFTRKALIWLVAGLLPLQPLAAVSCCCSADDQEGSDWCAESRPDDGKTCCCRSAPRCRAGTHAEADSCCNKTGRTSTEPGCGCTGGCSCESHDDSPPQQQAPMESRDRGAEQFVQPFAAATSFTVDELPAPRPGFSSHGPITSSGSQRCIVLCRFQL